MKDLLVKKLKKRFSNLKKYIYLTFVMIIIDICAMIIYKELFLDFFNILATVLYLSAIIYTLVKFKQEFNVIDKDVYKSIVRVRYVMFISVVVLFANMIYIVVAKVAFNFEYIFRTLTKGKY